MIIWFFFQSILSIIIFMIFVLTGKYGDGYIGMAPLSVLLAIVIQLIISIVLYYSVRSFINKKYKYLFLLLHLIIFELSFLFFTNSIPIINIFEEDFKGFISRCQTFSSLISGVIVLIVFLSKKR